MLVDTLTLESFAIQDNGSSKRKLGYKHGSYVWYDLEYEPGIYLEHFEFHVKCIQSYDDLSIGIGASGNNNQKWTLREDGSIHPGPAWVHNCCLRYHNGDIMKFMIDKKERKMYAAKNNGEWLVIFENCDFPEELKIIASVSFYGVELELVYFKDYIAHQKEMERLKEIARQEEEERQMELERQKKKKEEKEKKMNEILDSWDSMREEVKLLRTLHDSVLKEIQVVKSDYETLKKEYQKDKIKFEESQTRVKLLENEVLRRDKEVEGRRSLEE